MDQAVISQHKDGLLKAMPEISGYISTFRSINKRWDGAITAGMIETGRMSPDASLLFAPLINDMGSTKTNYSTMQEQLVEAILFEMVKKVVLEITDAAKFTINILKRNLFERTADVGYLATDAEIVNFLKMARQEEDWSILDGKAGEIRERLAEYQYEYTVYDEIIVLDEQGRVRTNLDSENAVARSTDPLLALTQRIDLHDASVEDKYIETFRPSDLRPGRGNTLIYSQKIEDPDTFASLGTLCLCFDFEDEMAGIFKDLNQGNSRMVLAILDHDGTVMSSNNTEVLPLKTKVPVDLDTDFRLMDFRSGTYLVSTVTTDGYQGFYGLTWYGLAMMDTKDAFLQDSEDGGLEEELIDKLHDFSSVLASIKIKSDELLSDMKLDSINGQIKAAKFEADAFVEVLRFVDWIGDEIDGLFSSAIMNLQQIVVASLLNDVEFRAFQGNNIADRNLYERANDVCWWALTPLFRTLLTKHADQGLDDQDRQALTANLQYINNLYTPYLRLVLADAEGVVLATSNPPGELEERFVREGVPKEQEFVGMRLEPGFVRTAMALESSKDYCVSSFEPTPLYGGRHTYVYSTAVRDPERGQRTVGVIQIVFDSEPQFQAMLSDALPRDEKKNILQGSFGVFADRGKNIISSTSPDHPVGGRLDLDDAYFQYANGERRSTIVEMGSRSYALGVQVSHGYREYKQKDEYDNDVVCLIFVPI